MMTDLQKEFFKRLKIPAKEITFDDLDEILLKMGLILPMKISILWLVLLKTSQKIT